MGGWPQPESVWGLWTFLRQSLHVISMSLPHCAGPRCSSLACTAHVCTHSSCAAPAAPVALGWGLSLGEEQSKRQASRALWIATSIWESLSASDFDTFFYFFFWVPTTYLLLGVGRARVRSKNWTKWHGQGCLPPIPSVFLCLENALSRRPALEEGAISR